MADRFISDLIGTLRTYFKIGSVRLKNSSGVLEIKNTGDTAYAQTNTYAIGVLGSNASNKITVGAPAGLSGNMNFVLPPDHGTVGYFLRTDGSGTTTWVPGSSNATVFNQEAFTEGTSSPLTIFTPPANATITKVVVNVTVAASGGSPTLSVGVSGTVERDMAAADIDLKTVGVYEVTPMTDVTGTPAAVIATITPSAQTFTGTVWVECTVAA